jgi:hypothetical protein
MVVNPEKKTRCELDPVHGPKRGNSRFQPCLYCAQRHEGNNCPYKHITKNLRCLNCNGNHATESDDCKSAAVKRYRQRCYRLGRSLPWWARHLNIPDVPQLPPTETQSSIRRARGRPSFVAPPSQPEDYINPGDGVAAYSDGTPGSSRNPPISEELRQPRRAPRAGVPPERQSDGDFGSSNNPIVAEDQDDSAAESRPAASQNSVCLCLITNSCKRRH